MVPAVVVDREMPVCAHRKHRRREVAFEPRLLVAELVPQVDAEPTEDPRVDGYRQHAVPRQRLRPDEVRVSEEREPKHGH